MSESKHVYTGDVVKDLYRSEGAVMKDLDKAHQADREAEKARHLEESREHIRIGRLLHGLDELCLPDMASYDLREKIIEGKITSFRLPSESELATNAEIRRKQLLEEAGPSFTQRRGIQYGYNRCIKDLSRLRQEGVLRLETS